MKTQDEINGARDKVEPHEESKYHSMTYEQGIADALDWVSGHVDDEEWEY